MGAMGIHHSGVGSPKAMAGGALQIDRLLAPGPKLIERTPGNWFLRIVPIKNDILVRSRSIPDDPLS